MINPGAVPQIDGDLDAVAASGASLVATGAAFAATGADVHATWQGLAGFYAAPEAGELFAATVPVRARAGSAGADLSVVGSALAGYAEEVRPLQVQLRSLRARASAFVSAVSAEEDWDADQARVEEHNRLLAAVNVAVAAWMDAQRRCANAINAAYGGTRWVVDDADGTTTPDEWGHTAATLHGAAAGERGVPWGSPAEWDKPWWRDAWDGAVSFGRGLVADGLWGTVTGAWDMVNVTDWDTFAASWTGLGKLAMALNPVHLAIDQTLGMPGLAKGELGDTLTGAGKALVAWDTWGEDPARAGGAVVGNIIGAVLGTKGAGAAARTGLAARAGTAAPGTADRPTLPPPAAARPPPRPRLP